MTSPDSIAHDVTDDLDRRKANTMATWLITGCSTGLGRALATTALDRGETVVVTARDAASVEDLVRPHPDTALALSLDVTDYAQVRDVVRTTRERFGAIDVLVNNAGHSYRAAVEEAAEDQVQELFATNFFGPAALIRAVLPEEGAAGCSTYPTFARLRHRTLTD